MVAKVTRARSIPQVIPFDLLPSCNLIVDAVYEGGRYSAQSKGTANEPISKLLPGVSNSSGFRIPGGHKNPKFVVLYSSGRDLDWPDDLDVYTGRFDYYGDNKRPGSELHDTDKKGNFLLKSVFERIHSGEPDYSKVPPFFIFFRYPTPGSGSSVQFKGLAVPGYPSVSSSDDLVAIWRSKDGQRFQNYRAVFTILDEQEINRDWLTELSKNGPPALQYAPDAWRNWVNGDSYKPLKAPPTKTIRSAQDQVPVNKQQEDIVLTIYDHFRSTPTAFEPFACDIFAMHEHPRVSIDYVTRPSRDGGRDAIGRYRVGVQSDPVYAEFALEAKLWRPPSSGKPQGQLGVKEVQRVISRIKHRQFGVIVTTGTVHEQAYSEVREDGHPIVFLCARDISEILIDSGLTTPSIVSEYLNRNFPV